MIAVLGRPRASSGDGAVGPAGLAAGIALAVAAAGARVELVGTIGDDDTGDAIAVALGRRGVGHAALLRVPGAVTPTVDAATPLPRLDARDVDLGLRYITTIGVIVAAEPLPEDVAAVVADAAAYHGAALVAIAGEDASAALPGATVLEPPPDGTDAFAGLVARYAVELDGGTTPAQAFARAREQTGWTSRA